ncbi:MAG: GIY-YIG nuclease family protein [Bacteroidales bacterium]|nr:GIY-YIG nuclease family protein [Bacteroidales bacterium]MCF8403354.1 GIY-YIG nuclease family protein [Bacteroidales bacterium]
MYSIIDIETTGLSPKREKITEIAIYVHDGEKVVDEFSSLINPEVDIPYRITQITGIDNRMVKKSPKFYEVAKRIIEMTENTIFVGHNVHFDYNFIRKEFLEFGYDYQRKKICTAKLSRKLLPGRRSYSLGKLCNELGIENPHRHRAFGDATATTRLFEILMKVEKNIEAVSLRELNTNLDRDIIRKLPQEPGVYYFYNNEGELIYVGKSKNVHDRVLSHLSNNSSKRAIEMRNQISDIGYELTGNELIALLLESDEIKKHLPRYNRAQRRSNSQWGLYYNKDENGYLRLKIQHNDRDELPLTTFNSLQAAKNHVFTLVEAFNLCQKFCGLYDAMGACFHYNLKQCNGACIGEESPGSYNLRVLQATEPYRFDKKNFLIVDRGRSDGEKSLIGVENGKYLGFGYINFELNGNLNIEDLKSSIKKYPDNRDVQQIIRGYIKRNKALKMVDF